MKLFKRKKYDTKRDFLVACINQDTAAQTMLYNLYKSKLLDVCYRYTRTSSEAEDYYLIVGLIPTSGFQILDVIPKDGLVYQNFRFAKLTSLRSLGYKIQIGVERRGVQFLVKFAKVQKRQSGVYLNAVSGWCVNRIKVA